MTQKSQVAGCIAALLGTALLSAGCGASSPAKHERSADTAPAQVGVSPPASTGTEAVGFERKTLTDHRRRERLVPGGGPRRVAIRVWYPAAAPGPKPARVFTQAEQSAWEALGKLGPGSLDGLAGTATEGAQPAPGRHPVLLLSHGFGETTAFLSSDATDLASHGYVVVGIVGAVGHSNGGATAAGTVLVDRRLDAGVDLDGAMFGPVITRGLDRPFGVARGGGPDAAYRTLTQLRRHLRGPHPFVQWSDTAHHGFTDLVWLAPQVHLDPAAADVGAVDPTTAVRQQRAWLLRFFDRYVGR